MWMLILIQAAMMMTLLFPRLSKGLAWVITMTITVPLVMLGGGCMGYAIALLTGMTSGSWEAFIMCCLLCGTPPSLFICWVIFS